MPGQDTPRIAVYPGSFDPLTYGHLDVLSRGIDLFDRVIVAILENSAKQALFATNERIEMIQEAVKGKGDVVVDVFGGLLVDYAETMGASVMPPTSFRSATRTRLTRSSSRPGGH